MPPSLQSTYKTKHRGTYCYPKPGMEDCILENYSKVRRQHPVLTCLYAVKDDGEQQDRCSLSRDKSSTDLKVAPHAPHSNEYPCPGPGWKNFFGCELLVNKFYFNSNEQLGVQLLINSPTHVGKSSLRSICPHTSNLSLVLDSFGDWKDNLM